MHCDARLHPHHRGQSELSAAVLCSLNPNVPLVPCNVVHPRQACKHTFEKQAIHNHIKIARNNRAPAACPVAGCVRKVQAEDLVIDEAMLRLVSSCDDMFLRLVVILWFSVKV